MGTDASPAHSPSGQPAAFRGRGGRPPWLILGAGAVLGGLGILAAWIGIDRPAARERPAPPGGIPPQQPESFSIEPGPWCLTVYRTELIATDGRMKEKPMPSIRAAVEVVIEWLDRRKSNGEIERVQHVEIRSEAPGNQPIIGVLGSEDGELNPQRMRLKAQGKSREWDFTLLGAVKSRRLVEGTIVGREIPGGNRTFQGAWTMVKSE